MNQSNTPAEVGCNEGLGGWRTALEEALSVCGSVHTGRDRRVVRDGCVLYLQTEEWCKWAEEEVAPKLRAALSNSPQPAERVPLTTAEFAALETDLIAECERAMQQRDEFLKTGVRTGGDGMAWNTCFGFVLRKHGIKPPNAGIQARP